MSELVQYARSLSARRQARRFKVPAPGQFVRLPSVEVLHEFMQANGLRVKCWRGDVLVLEKIAVSDQHSALGERSEQQETAAETPAEGAPASR